jgi:hypothetical protein
LLEPISVADAARQRDRLFENAAGGACVSLPNRRQADEREAVGGPQRIAMFPRDREALRGAIGAIGTFYNLFGPSCKRAREAMVAGNVDFAFRFMQRFQQTISEVLGTGSTWSFLRAAMQMKYKIDIGMPRPPLGSCDKPWAEADVRKYIALVDEAT